jgi:hypothetical protein
VSKKRTISQGSSDRKSKILKITNLKAGSLVTVDLSLPGLTPNQETILYLRNSAITLVNHLTTNTISLVQGPPGSGKSSMTWVWACQQANSKQSICWIHFDQVEGIVCTPSQENDWSRFLYGNDELVEVVDACVENILILDGLVQSEHALIISHAFVWLSKSPQRKLVLVSSLQMYIKPETITYHNITTFNMPSWTRDEYLAAYKEEIFRNSINDQILPGEQEEKIEDKYCLAGGCARWMFERTVVQVIEEISSHISRIGADMNLLINGLLGVRANNSISHLFSIYGKDEVFLVSEYVTRMLSEKCEASFLVQASKTSLAMNPSFDGWILEADFLLQVRLAEKSKGILVYPGLDEKSEKWMVASRRQFLNVSDIVIQPNERLENIWFIPSKWNQACYDAVQILPENAFRFIQVTRALSHSLKLKYIVEFLNRFRHFTIPVNSIEICFILPNDPQYKSFTPKIAEGTLGIYQEKLKKRKESNVEFEYFKFGLDRHQ